MSKCRDGLHLNSIALVKRMVQDTWSIDNLPTRVFVVTMAHEQVLGREGIRLYVNVGIRHVVDKAGLAYVGEASNDKSSAVRID